MIYTCNRVEKKSRCQQPTWDKVVHDESHEATDKHGSAQKHDADTVQSLNSCDSTSSQKISEFMLKKSFAY